MLLRPGEEPIPGYRLAEFLGKGQFGQVWKAQSPGKTYVALKFLDLSGKQGRKEFRAIQQIKQIRHAHLMPITALWLLDEAGEVLDDEALDDIGAESSLIAGTIGVAEIEKKARPKPVVLVVAQLLGDKTLGDRLSECRQQGDAGIPVPELLTYMEEAAKGIDFLNSAKHELGSELVAIQHCDIKPANILLMGESVLICDYGVAHVLADAGDAARATGMIGSPAYMAPECIDRKPSPTSDQFSLAITYVELRTGKLPFTSESFADVLDSHRSGQHDLTGLPPAEQLVVQKATSPDPQKRYASSHEMVRQLRQAALGEQQVVPKKSRSVAILCIALVVCVGCIIAVFFGPGTGSPPANDVKPISYSIQLVPADAELTIDGISQVVTADGTLSLSRKPNQQVQIVAKKSPEFLDYEETVVLNQIKDQAIHIELRHNASYHAQEAFRLLNEQAWESALDEYARAISYDSRNAQMPAVAHRRSFPAEGRIRHADSSDDGRWLATLGDMGTLRLWDMESDPGQTEPIPLYNDGPMTEAWKVVVGQQWAVVTYLTGEVIICGLTANKVQHRLQVGEGPVEAAISANQKWLVTASSDGESIGEYVVHSWDLAADDVASSKAEVGRHQQMVSCLSVASDSASVISGSYDASVKRWTLGKGEQVADELIGRQSDEIECLVVVKDFLAFAGRVDQSQSVADPFRITVHRPGIGASILPSGHTEPITTLVTARDQQQLVSASEDQQLQAWDLSEESAADISGLHPIVLNTNQQGLMNSICVVQGWLLTGSDNGTVLLWDYQNMESPGPIRLAKLSGGISTVTISSDGRWVVVCSADGVWFWDLPRSTLVKRACDRAGVAPQEAELQDSALLST